MQANNAIIIIDLKYADINLKVFYDENCSWHKKYILEKCFHFHLCWSQYMKLWL